MADRHPVQLMPTRALIIWAVGVFFIAAHMQTAQADYWECESDVGLQLDQSERYQYRGYGASRQLACEAFIANLLNTGELVRHECNDPHYGEWYPTGFHVRFKKSTSGCTGYGSGWVYGDTNSGLVSSPNDCPSGMILNDGICVTPECPSGQFWNEASNSCKCDNPDQEVNPGDPDQCVSNCRYGTEWDPASETCKYECESQKGRTEHCTVDDSDPLTGFGSFCIASCEVQIDAVVDLAGPNSFVQGRYSGQPGACAWNEHQCIGQDPGAGDENGTDIGTSTDEGGTGCDGDNCLGPDGGSIGDNEFGNPPPGGCAYSDDGTITCDDSAGGGPGNIGDLEEDTTGDGNPDDGFSISDHWGPSTPAGTTIIDPDTGQTLGEIIDQDGDGTADGIDTDGDGDIDIDSPDDPGGGQDNNGDGVVNDSDGDNDGDGKKGQAGDCIDDPETEENECGGTDGEPGEASVAGLSCEEEPSCQPAKDDIQGQLWCAQLKLQHKVSCQYHAPGAADSPDSLMADKPEDDGSELFEEINLEEEGPGLSTGVVSAGGACFTDIPFDVLGASFNVPLSALCPYFGAAGYMILLVGYMVAAMVVYRGMFS